MRADGRALLPLPHRHVRTVQPPHAVMPGLDPGISTLRALQSLIEAHDDVDGRDKRGHDPGGEMEQGSADIRFRVPTIHDLNFRVPPSP